MYIVKLLLDEIPFGSFTQTLAEVAAVVHEGVQVSSQALRIVLQLESAQNLMLPKSDASLVLYFEGLNVMDCSNGAGVAWFAELVIVIGTLYLGKTAAIVSTRVSDSVSDWDFVLERESTRERDSVRDFVFIALIVSASERDSVRDFVAFLVIVSAKERDSVLV